MLATNMTCVDMMYQSYASYFPYQRPAAASPPDPFKKFGHVKHDPSALDAASGTYSSHSSHSASSLSSLPGTSLTSGHSTHAHHHQGHSSGHHSSSTHGGSLSNLSHSGPSPSSPPDQTVTKMEDSTQQQQQQQQQDQQQQQQRQQQQQQQQQHHLGDKDTLGSAAAGVTQTQTPHNAQYLSTNCVLFTYYAGDVASHVDEHFTRALSQQGTSSTPSSSPSAAYHNDGAGASHNSKAFSWKASSPMSQRNFPASFWNSSYQQVASLSHPDPLGTLHPASAGDAYMTSSLHSMSSLGTDPWARYSLTSQSVPYSAHAHHNVHDMASYAASMAAGSSRFQPHYGSLLGSGRLGAQCDLGKHSMEGHWGSRYHAAESLGAPSGLTHHDTPHPLHSALTAPGGIDAPIQEPSKDLYWF